MKKFEKLLNDRKKFAPKQKLYERVFCAIDNDVLHIMVVIWAKPENTQITTTITVIFLFLFLDTAALKLERDEFVDIRNGDDGGWRLFKWILVVFITRFFLFLCFVINTTSSTFKTISIIKTKTSLIKKSTLLTICPIELWPKSLRPMKYKRNVSFLLSSTSRCDG